MNTDTRDAIAIVGMSCRFAPDLTTPEKLWSFLVNGHGSVTDMPDKRWDPYTSAGPEATAILRRTTRKGAFLDDIEGFDAEFFQITPREAEYIDPQQRILLELAWEALGDAGVPPLSLAGGEAGVFVSANSNDYGRRLLEDLSRTGAWAVNGTTYYGIANRISYFLDLRGPSMAVDTACAGSLTALHLACQSLRLGETPVAIVGGINIMASPALMVALDAAGATSPDGRSKAFDKAADGYGRGEGAGVVVLKRLADARRDGDRVRAVIRGSGVFQDGRSEGMMAPSADAQEHMLRQVYQRAGVDPGTVDYVEAHGTGTPLGDLAEATAIGAVLGRAEPGEPLLFGSLKANIGHVEAASGIAGAIKVVLAMEHGEIPASPHEEVNPELDLPARGLRLVDKPAPWPQGERTRRAGVSSYGVGGTIAHLILEEAPPVPDVAPTPGANQALVLPLSAGSDAGLRGLAAETAAWLRGHRDVALEDVAHTLTRRRSHLAVRGAVIAESAAAAADRFDVLAAGERGAGITVGKALPAAARGAVWVFSGHGAQWTGMGRELLREDAAFAAAIDGLAEVFAAELGWTPRAVIEAGGPWTVTTVQAMTFAMQVALADSWQAMGVRPAAVVGHSVGEIAAAVVAGCLDRTEAARFACLRAAALERVAGRGAMVLVGLPFSEVEARLSGRSGATAAIAASPRSTVVSGDVGAVEAVMAELTGAGVEARRVNTDVAFHSPHVDEVLPDVAGAAARLSARPAEVTLYSTALADPRATDPRAGGYWETNLRAPVRFAHAVRAALDDGLRVFLEVSAHPVVAHSITETAHDAGAADALVVVSLRRDRPEGLELRTALAQLHTAGVPVDWPDGGSLVSVPSTKWQHRPYWIFPETAAMGGRGHDPDTHTLLGGRSTVAGTPAQHVWQTHLDMSNRPYAQDHKVVGVETVPASVVINSFVTAASRDGHTAGLTDIVLRTPLAATPPRVVQVVLDQNQVRLASRIRRDEADGDAGHENEWIQHATATVDREAVIGSRPMEDVAAIRARCPEEWTWSRVDATFRQMGVEGYTFPWVVEELRRNAVEQLAVVTIDHTPKLHPSSWTAVIDGALTVSGVLVTKENSATLRTSSHLGSIAFRGDPPGRIVVHTTRSATSPDTAVDVLVADERGSVVCEATGLRFTEVQDRPGASLRPRDMVHEVVWEPVDLPATDGALPRVLLYGDEDTTAPLARRWSALGASCTRLDDLDALADVRVDGPAVLMVAPRALAGAESPEEAAERCAWELVDAVQRVGRVGGMALWCLTRGVRAAGTDTALAHAPLWGASRVIAGERSDIWGGVIDIDGEVGPDAADRLLAVIASVPPTEDILSLGADGVRSARLVAVDRQPVAEAVECKPNGTYLITGGLGGLGLEVADFLVDRGARRLVLVGRRGLPPRTEWDAVTDPAVRAKVDAVLALEARGATVRVLALDISDARAVTAALSPAALQLPPIRGVVHAAGVVSDALVDKTDRAGLRTTLGPKARGAMVLHRLFPPGSLDFFTMFSSCGQFARLTGQASYAAANSFLDALAASRNAAGETGSLSLAWPQWRGVGMGETTAGTTILEAESRGLGGISAAEAFRAWVYAERFGLPYYAILRVLPERSLPVFSHLVGAADEVEVTAGSRVDWDEVVEADLDCLVLDDVHEQVAAELSLATADVDVDRPLVELGVDSVLTVGLRVRLHRRFGIDLPPTILWSNPTVRSVAQFLAEGVLARRAEV